MNPTNIRVFLSYSRTKLEIAKLLKAFMEEGVDEVQLYDVFIDVDHIKYGEEWKKKIAEEIYQRPVFVCLISEKWLQSEICHYEFDTAEQFNKQVVPILLENGLDIPDKISKLNYIDLTGGITPDTKLRVTKALHQAVVGVISRGGAIPPDETPESMLTKLMKVDSLDLSVDRNELNKLNEFIKYLLKIGYENHIAKDIYNRKWLLEKQATLNTLLSQITQLNVIRDQYELIKAAIRDPKSGQAGCNSLQKFVEVHPGYDPENLIALCSEMTRDREYNEIKALLSDLTTVQDGYNGFISFAERYPDHDPENLKEHCKLIERDREYSEIKLLMSDTSSFEDACFQLRDFRKRFSNHDPDYLVQDAERVFQSHQYKALALELNLVSDLSEISKRFEEFWNRYPEYDPNSIKSKFQVQDKKPTENERKVVIQERIVRSPSIWRPLALLALAVIAITLAITYGIVQLSPNVRQFASPFTMRIVNAVATSTPTPALNPLCEGQAVWNGITCECPLPYAWVTTLLGRTCGFGSIQSPNIFPTLINP